MYTQRTVLLGTLFTVIGYFLFTANDAVVKWLVTDLPIVQILCVRSIVTMGICVLVTGRHTIVQAIYSPIRYWLLFRGLLVLMAWLFYYAAAPYLALGEMVTLYFAAPIFVAMLAGKLLGEKVTLRGRLAISIGFIGVLAASRLNHLPNLLPSLSVLLAAILWAINTILYRKDIAAETNSVQISTMNVVLFIVSGTTLCWVGISMTTAHIGWLIFIGVIGASAQFTVLTGLRRIAASVAAPLEFTALIWSFILGYLIWDDQPVIIVIIGALLISLSGVLIVFEAWQKTYPTSS